MEIERGNGAEAIFLILRYDMALAKTSKIATRAAKPRSVIEPTPVTRSRSPLQTASPESRQETLVERIAAATEELATGLAEASAAARQLRS